MNVENYQVNGFNHKIGLIQTVLGSLLPEELGWCQCHEHLFIARGASYSINQALYMDDPVRSTSELCMYKSAGGESLVDAQPVGCGRIAAFLPAASKASGVNIIASTGFHKLQFYPDNHWIRTISEDSLTELYIDELEKGMYADGDTGEPSIRLEAKAGIIKVALDSTGIAGDYEKLFRAAANASQQTGRPVLCHVEHGGDAFETVNFFTRMGMKLQSLILCHLDRVNNDSVFHKELAAAGVYLEYDTIGRFKYHSDEKEAGLISDMVGAGFMEQVLLGLDTTRDRLKSYGGRIGLDYIKTEFIPKLLSNGIDAETIEAFAVKNPQKALRKK